MKISKITINNFRSIKSSSFELDQFNVFVGQNNHGKTNLFEAVDWFYFGKGDLNKIRYGRNGDEEISVEIEFSDIQEGISKMKNEKNKTVIKNLLGENDSVRVKRTSVDSKTRKIFDPVKSIWLEKNPTGFDSAFNDFLPKFEYVTTKVDPLELAKYGKNSPITNMLSGVLSTILEENPEYSDFRQKFDLLFSSPKSEVRIRLDELSGKVKVYLEKQFEDCNKVVFEVASPAFEDLLKNFETSIDDGVYTDADEKGDGMQRALMLAIIQAYADFRREHEETSKYFLFFIDEGELHLHPSAQRKLKNALLELSQKGDQIFINTHSSVLVVDDSVHQRIFKVEKINKETNICQLDKNEKPKVIYELLGGSPADLLLPRNFMIVEGISDSSFISEIIKRFYSDKPEIQIISANGDLKKQQKSMSAINAAYIPLGVSTPIYKEKVIILCDNVNERESDKTEFLKAYPYLIQNNQYYELPVNAIEKYYPDKWKKTDKEITELDNTKNGKLTYARDIVAKEISQEQFEKEMTVIFEAVKKCWEYSY